MQITVYHNFTKRKNSTKQPSANSGTQMNVLLKSETSIEKPSFILATNDATINYIKAFDTYFFVDNVIALDNGRFEYVCSKDLLATYKSDITSTTAFIAYSNSKYDEGINDNRVASVNTTTVRALEADTAGFNNTGYYVLHIAGYDIFNVDGFSQVFILTSTEIKQLALALDSAGDTILANLAKKFTAPYDAIISCKWLPFDYSLVTTSRCYHRENISIGGYGTGVSGYIVNDTSPLPASTSFDLSSSFVGVPLFKRVAPYTTISAYIPYFGNVNVPALEISKNETVIFSYGLDFITGDVTVKVTLTQTSKILSTYNYNVAVECPVSANESNMSSLLSNIVPLSSSLALASVNPVALAGVAVSAVNAGMESVQPTHNVKGSISGRSMQVFGVKTVVRISTLDTTSSEALQTTCGRPYMRVGSLSGCSGYMQTTGASVNMAGHGSDKDIVNNMLDSGIYIE